MSNRPCTTEGRTGGHSIDTSFADRLARIQATQEALAVPGGEAAQLIGQSPRNQTPSIQEHYPTHAPKTYDQRSKMAIINNLILGLIWMVPTGFAAVNFFAVVDFLAGKDASAEAVLNTQVGLGMAILVSGGLFYWVGREALRDLGKVHGMPLSLAIGGALGAVIGAGPVTLARAFMGNG
ncbi:hypothetical protein, partial [Pseudooctadecabacter sp.]